tara:strand:- start:86 stop:844 length:759 start_codon:yes stop_codon:yes gene_type:complete
MFGNKKKKAKKYFEEGSARLQSGQLPAAIALFESAVSLEPENPDYWHHLGHSLRESSKKYRVTRGPSDELPNLYQAHVDGANNVDQLHEAYLCFEKFSKLSPSSHAFGILGDVASERKDYLNSIKHYEQAIEYVKNEYTSEHPDEIELKHKYQSDFLTNIGVCHAEVLYAYMNNTEVGKELLTKLGFYEKDGMIIDGVNGTEIPKIEFIQKQAKRALTYYRLAYQANEDSETAEKNYDSFREFYLKNISDHE